MWVLENSCGPHQQDYLVYLFGGFQQLSSSHIISLLYCANLLDLKGFKMKRVAPTMCLPKQGYCLLIAMMIAAQIPMLLDIEPESWTLVCCENSDLTAEGYQKKAMNPN